MAAIVRGRNASKSVRRRTYISEFMQITNGSTTNLVSCIGITGRNNRFVVERIHLLCHTTLSANAGNTVTYSVGHATADGTFSSNSVLDAYSIGATLLSKRILVIAPSSMASTLKTAKGPTMVGLPVIPSNSSVWVTATEGGTVGTGSLRMAVTGWETDDETPNKDTLQ